MADALRITLGQPIQFAASTNGTPLALFTLNASTDKLEFIFQHHGDAATITHIGFRCAGTNGTPPTYKIGFQGVVDGVPDGTYLGGASPASATFTPPNDFSWDNTVQYIALDNSYAISNNELVAIVIDHSTGTIDTVNNMQVTYTVNNLEGPRLGFPYAITNDAGSRTRIGTTPHYGYKSASRSYGMLCHSPVSGTMTTGQEFALRFTVPADWCSTYKVAGVRLMTRSPTAGGILTMTLYSGTTALQSMTHDTDNTVVANTLAQLFKFAFTDATLDALDAGTEYRIGISCDVNFYQLYLPFTDAQDAQAMDGRTAFRYSSRTSGGATAWTDDDTRRLFMSLILEDITEPAGGAGGLLTHPGMAGGLRG